MSGTTSTIRGVREALPAAERAEFTAGIENVPAGELRMALMRWVPRIPTGHDAAEEALAERLASGDLTEVTFADEPVTTLEVAPVDAGRGRSQRSAGPRQ